MVDDQKASRDESKLRINPFTIGIVTLLVFALVGLYVAGNEVKEGRDLLPMILETKGLSYRYGSISYPEDTIEHFYSLGTLDDFLDDATNIGIEEVVIDRGLWNFIGFLYEGEYYYVQFIDESVARGTA